MGYFGHTLQDGIPYALCVVHYKFVPTVCCLAFSEGPSWLIQHQSLHSSYSCWRTRSLRDEGRLTQLASRPIRKHWPKISLLFLTCTKSRVEFAKVTIELSNSVTEENTQAQCNVPDSRNCHSDVPSQHTVFLPINAQSALTCALTYKGATGKVNS